MTRRLRPPVADAYCLLDVFSILSQNPAKFGLPADLRSVCPGPSERTERAKQKEKQGRKVKQVKQVKQVRTLSEGGTAALASAESCTRR